MSSDRGNPVVRGRRDDTLVPILAGLGTVVAYVSLLGWDRTRQVQADGTAAALYDPWQVVALAGAVIALVVWGALRNQPIGTAWTSGLVLSLCWTVDASTDPGSGQGWIAEAFLVLFVAVVGLFAVAVTVRTIRTRGIALRSVGIRR